MREPRREDPAESFGPYLIYECLGRGGMATVHRAKQTGIEGFERPVALKRMLPWLCSDTEFIKSFVREARLAAQLRHTNIVQTYDLGKVDSIYYIAMELVSGRDLRELLRHAHNVVGPPPVPLTLSVLFQVCDALDYAHNFRDDHGRPLGLVHRDISPANVIIAEDGSAKVVDFGVAKGVTATLATMSGMLKGKFAYMAPEMLQGQVDARCDLFAVGVVAWELLTARPLFAGGDDMEILQRVTTWDPPPPSSVNPKVPRDLDAWVAMALTKNPLRRFQSAAQMRAGLELVARTPSMRCNAADIAAWMSWAFAQKAGQRPSPPPQIPAPLEAPMMPMPTNAASTTAPPVAGAIGSAPPMPMDPMTPITQPRGPIGGADSVSITIDDSTNPRVPPPPMAPAPRPTPQVIASSPEASSGARTMMLDEGAIVSARTGTPAPRSHTPTPAASRAHPPTPAAPHGHGHGHGQAGMTTLPGTGGPIKPVQPPGSPHAAPQAAAPRAPAPARQPNPNATMMGTGVPAAVAAAAAAARSSLSPAPQPIPPSTLPPSGPPAPSAARTVMYDGAPAAPHRPPAQAHGHLPAMPPGASPDHGHAAAPPPAQAPAPYAAPPGYPNAGYPGQMPGAGYPGQVPGAGYPAPMPNAGYPAPMQGAPAAQQGAPPAWGAGTPGGQPYNQAPTPPHMGGPVGGFAPNPYQQNPNFLHGGAPGGDLPLPRPPRGKGGLIAIIVVLCAGAAVGGYFLLQHLS